MGDESAGADVDSRPAGGMIPYKFGIVYSYHATLSGYGDWRYLWVHCKSLPNARPPWQKYWFFIIHPTGTWKPWRRPSPRVPGRAAPASISSAYPKPRPLKWRRRRISN